MADELITPSALERLSGTERLGPSTVGEFWRWALGDLRMNNTRGVLIEFLVAQALGDSSPFRVEWGPWDVQARDGTLVEIKATGRLQSWALRKLSTPSWSFRSVRADKVWSEAQGDFVAVDPEARVHVWVFALHTAEQPERYDPLDVEQWEFRVISHRELRAAGQVSARLSFFEQRGIEPVSYSQLSEAVARARAENDRRAKPTGTANGP